MTPIQSTWDHPGQNTWANESTWQRLLGKFRAATSYWWNWLDQLGHECQYSAGINTGLVLPDCRVLRPAWQSSAHTKFVDAQLHSAMRLISGTVCSPPLLWLLVLGNIERPALWCVVATDRLLNRVELYPYRRRSYNPTSWFPSSADASGHCLTGSRKDRASAVCVERNGVWQTMKCVSAATLRLCHTLSTSSPWQNLSAVYTWQSRLLSIGLHMHLDAYDNNNYLLVTVFSRHCSSNNATMENLNRTDIIVYLCMVHLH